MNKVMIMTDLEGPSGINGRSDGIGNTTVNSATACEALLQEVNACVEGLVKAGADKIIVWDGHGGSNSIDIMKLHPAAMLGTIGGDLAPCVFLDATYTAVVQLGAHALSGVADGYMNHSFNSHGVCNIWLNDSLIGEIGIEAFEAAYFGVPNIMVSSDDAGCREARELLGTVETVSTKTALSRYTVVNRNPVHVHEDLTATAERALRNVKSFPVLKLPKHFELKLEVMCQNIANSYEKIGAKRLNHNTVAFYSDDFIDVWAQHALWAPGLHNTKFGISPTWTGFGI